MLNRFDVQPLVASIADGKTCTVVIRDSAKWKVGGKKGKFNDFCLGTS